FQNPVGRVFWRVHGSKIKQWRNPLKWPVHRRSKKENHRLASGKRPRQAHHQLQTPRLALLPPTLLGRTISHHLEKGCHWSSPRSITGKRPASSSACIDGLQTHGTGRAPSP